jgi:hypothetical protein
MNAVIKVCADWVVYFFQKRKAQQLATVKADLLIWFETARDRGCFGRFCPDLAYILEDFKKNNAETLRLAVMQLIQEGFLEYDAGRYYLKCQQI